MISINEYLNKTVDFEIGEETIHVKLPSCNIMAQLLKMEGELGKGDLGNDYKIKQNCTQLLLNNNMERRDFTEAEMDKLPSDAILMMYKKIIEGKVETEKDPNSKSQSQTAK